jgi:hypothetical protein
VRRKAPDQLAFDFPSEPRGITLTRPLARHRSRRSLLEKFRYVRRFFPELDGRAIRVGITRAAAGQAVPGGFEVWIHPSQTTYHSLSHEFVHLLQGTGEIPKGEKSCDVFALARHWTLNDSAPFYVRVPAELRTLDGKMGPEGARLLWTAARRALAAREAGVRNYIAFFEKTLESLYPAPERKAAGGRGRKGDRLGANLPAGLEMDELLGAPDADTFD